MSLAARSRKFVEGEESIENLAMRAVWPLTVYLIFIVLLTAGMIGTSFLLGQRHREKATDEPYESGISVTGSAHVRFPVQFYLIALFFLVFDLEAAFIFAWAVAARDLGWAGYWGAFFFIAVLFALLIYEWKTGALDWGPRGRGRRCAAG